MTDRWKKKKQQLLWIPDYEAKANGFHGLRVSLEEPWAEFAWSLGPALGKQKWINKFVVETCFLDISELKTAEFTNLQYTTCEHSVATR